MMGLFLVATFCPTFRVCGIMGFCPMKGFYPKFWAIMGFCPIENFCPMEGG